MAPRSLSAGVGTGEPIDLRFTACDKCEAIIDVKLNGVSVFPDGDTGHAEWHDRLRREVLNARLQMPTDTAAI